MPTQPKVKRIKLSELLPDRHNANAGTVRGQYMVDTSIEQFGAGRSILIDRDGEVIAGNKTLMAWQDAGFEDVIVIESDGKSLIAVQRQDMDLDDPATGARGLAYSDNRSSELGLAWDAEQILADIESGLDLSALWHDDELGELLAGLVEDEHGNEPTKATAQVYSNDEIIEDAFQYFRRAGFPYRHLEPFECKQEINKLATLDGDSLINTNVAHHVADSYHKHRFHAHAIGMKSPYEAFCDDMRLRKAIGFELENGRVDTGYINALTTISTTQAAANFRPGFALYYYRKFNVDGGTVLDTSTGYGGRLVGFTASGFGKYIGIDPNTETHNANLKMCQDLGITAKVELHNLPAEDVKPTQFEGACDFAFTSPPYFKKEIYSEDDTQSWKRYGEFDDWVQGFLKPMFELQFISLKNGAYSVVNIADVRINSKRFPVVDQAIECGKSVGFDFVKRDEFPLASRFGLGHGDDVATEPVLIFKKPVA